MGILLTIIYKKKLLINQQRFRCFNFKLIFDAIIGILNLLLKNIFVFRYFNPQTNLRFSLQKKDLLLFYHPLYVYVGA